LIPGRTTGFDVSGILNAVRNAGGSVEIANE
jgi:hypothetical protein